MGIRPLVRLLPMLTLFVTAIIGFNGCAITGGQDKAPATYVLDAKALAVPKTKRRDTVILLASPRAEAAFDTTAIAYARAPLSLEFYRDSRWADTPARMLQPVISSMLEQTEAFRAVVTQPTLVDANLQLEVGLIRLAHEFFFEPSVVRLVLRASLIDTQRNRVLAARRFEALEKAPAENAYGGVQAANVALQRLLGELAEFVIYRGEKPPSSS